jgi:hypothetical protein
MDSFTFLIRIIINMLRFNKHLTQLDLILWTCCTVIKLLCTIFVLLFQNRPIRTLYLLDTAFWLLVLLKTSRKLVLKSFITARPGFTVKTRLSKNFSTQTDTTSNQNVISNKYSTLIGWSWSRSIKFVLKGFMTVWPCELVGNNNLLFLECEMEEFYTKVHIFQ